MRQDWILCPFCSGKTRVKVRPDTVLINFPLYCPKCGKEKLISIKGENGFKGEEKNE